MYLQHKKISAICKRRFLKLFANQKSGAARGFVALMSVVIIAAILTVLVFTVGATTYFSRFDVVETEYKRVSLGYAEGCIDRAMLLLAQGTGITSGSCVNYDTDPPTYSCSGAKNVCRICTTTSSFPATINVRGYYNGAYTNLKVRVTNPNPGVFTVTNWSETGNGDSSCTTP